MKNLENACGAAVVKTILQKYRRNNSINYLFSDIELTSDGYSIFDVESELKKFNIEAESYFLKKIDSLRIKAR